MGLKSFLKGLESRPITPQIGSVPLPEIVASDDDVSVKSRRPHTPSFFKKRIIPAFRPVTPLKRAASGSTTSTSSILSTLQVGDLSPLTTSDEGDSEPYFLIGPSSPQLGYVNPQPDATSRHPTPNPVSRVSTPKPSGHAIPRSSASVTPADSSSHPSSKTHSNWAQHPDSPASSHHRIGPKPPFPARSSTPAPPRGQYSTPAQPRRASTPAPRPTPAPESHHPVFPVSSPLRPTANNALVLASDLATSAELHWQLLQFDPARGKPRLYFDVSQEPTLIRIFHKYMRPLMPDDKHKLAASTPLKEMMIRCAPLPLPAWDIRVRRYDDGPLRCIDVFEAIYESLSTPLSDAEKSQWAREYLESCEPYFQARCKASTALTDWEERQGLRRVDLLKGRTRFMGIARAAPGKNYWVLHVDKHR